MAIEDKLGWEIKSRNLIGINEERIKLNEDVSMFYNQLTDLCPSTTTANRIKRRVSEIEKSIKKLRLKNDFDKIVCEDIVSTIKCVKGWMDYILRDDKKNVSNLLAKIYARPSYIELVKLASNFENKMQDKFDRLTYNYVYRALSSDLESIRNEIKIQDVLSTIKKVITDFAKDHNLFKEDMSFEMEISPVTDGMFSYWHWEKMVLNPDRLYIYKENDKIKICKSLWYLIGIHEFIGHGLQRFYSKKFMPSGMDYEEREYNVLVHGVTGEGVSMMMEELSLDWFRKNRKKLRINQTDIKIMELFIEKYFNEKIYQSIHNIDYIKERKGENVDAHADIGKLSKFPVLGKDQYLFETESLHDTFPSLNYLLGYSNIKQILNRANVEFNSPNIVKRNKELFIKGLLLGSFRPDVQEKFFFEEYMPRVVEFIN